jgi:glutathione S-transferase
MTITLYELAAADRNVRFSPHCWKSRLALLHKQLRYQSEPVWFTEKEKIAMSNQGLLPVITNGDDVIHDSWDIAEYLENKYPDAPSLFADESTKSKAKAFNQWVSTVLSRHVPGIILIDIFNAIPEQDKAYFRSTREEKIGDTLENFGSNPEKHTAAFREALGEVRGLLADNDYLGGASPDYHDICLLSTFLWIATVSDVAFLAEDDVLNTWYQRVLNDYRSVIPQTVFA